MTLKGTAGVHTKAIRSLISSTTHTAHHSTRTHLVQRPYLVEYILLGYLCLVCLSVCGTSEWLACFELCATLPLTGIRRRTQAVPIGCQRMLIAKIMILSLASHNILQCTDVICVLCKNISTLWVVNMTFQKLIEKLLEHCIHIYDFKSLKNWGFKMETLKYKQHIIKKYSSSLKGRDFV